MAEQKVTPVSVMLKRAGSWQQEGKIHQAIDMYFRLAEDFPGTEEASKAEERLLSLAQELEEEGEKVHIALDICERLAAPSALAEGKRRFILSPMGRA